MKLVLLDTGPIVAYLDKSDSHHALVRERINGIRGVPVTTAAVITETMFFLQDIIEGPTRAVEFLAQAQAEIFDAFTEARLTAATALMEKYRDTPMDFADASLVVAAAELNADRILTLDERGFRTYRYKRNKSFDLMLQDIP